MNREHITTFAYAVITVVGLWVLLVLVFTAGTAVAR